MNEPWNWTEADLQALITNQVQEGFDLEYKASVALDKQDSNRTEISKDVSAFANSAGGTIVYGIGENKHFPTHLDAGSDPTLITKEWLEQIINSHIHRRIDGIRIKQIQLTQSPGRVAYVVHVPQSTTAHQARDKRYYKRHNFECLAMEDYEIRDVMNRSEGPDLRVAYSSSVKDADLSVYPLLSNSSLEAAAYVSIDLMFDADLVPKNPASNFRRGTRTILVGDSQVPMNEYHQFRFVPNFMPCILGDDFTLGAFVFQKPGDGDYLVGWKVCSPRMRPKEAWYSMNICGENATLTEIP
jgi:hypothetical protein